MNGTLFIHKNKNKKQKKFKNPKKKLLKKKTTNGLRKERIST